VIATKHERFVAAFDDRAYTALDGLAHRRRIIGQDKIADIREQLGR
jgi:hypothetical protein